MAITKSKSKTEAYADDELTAIAEAEASKQAFADAQESAFLRQAAVDVAELATAEIETQWNQGIETPTALDYAAAQAEEVKATALYGFAQSAVVRAEKAIVSTDKTLAEIVKPWIEAALPGVSVSATFLMPKGKPSILPVAYVIQSAKAKIVGGGVVSGSVDVLYVRSPLHREIDGKAVEHAASLAGCQIKAGGSSRTEDSQTIDTLRVNVEYGHAPIPVFTDAPTEAIANRLAQTVALALAGTTKAPTDPPMQMLLGGGYQSAAVTVRPNGGKVVKSETDTMGSRQTDVEVSFTYQTSGATRQLSTSMDARLRRLVESYVETFTQGLGVCQSAKVVSINSPDHSGLTNVRVLLSFASRSH